MTTTTGDNTDKKTIKFHRGQHARQKYYGSGLTTDHIAAYTEAMLEDPSVFEDTKNDELSSFFSSLQPGDIIGVVGDLLVVPEGYSFNPNTEFVRLKEFDGGTIKKPVVARVCSDIVWKNNVELGIYWRAGFVEHLYRAGAATDGGESMEIDEDVLKKQLTRRIEQAKAQQQARANTNTTSLPPSQPSP